MNKNLSFVLALVSILTVTLRVFAQNVSVSDYSVPVSQADNLRIDAFNFNYITSGSKVTGESGNLGVIYKNFYDSLPFAYSLDFIGSGTLNKDVPKDKILTDFTTDFSARVKKYVKSDGNLFGFGDVDHDFNKPFDRPSVDLTIGVGYGRSINATALAKAVRIEDFFLAEGLIFEQLPKETVIELGHIIERRSEYEDVNGTRYENYWFEDMENAIGKSRILGESLGAIGILRMREVLFQERINDRFYGWETTAGIKFQLLAEMKGMKRRDPSAAIGFRCSRPLNWTTQVNARFEFSTPFTGDFAELYNTSFITDFIYELTNKIDFTLRYLVRANKSNKDIDTDTVNSLGAAITFFLENKINLTISEQFDKEDKKRIEQQFNITLNYRVF